MTDSPSRIFLLASLVADLMADAFLRTIVSAIKPVKRRSSWQSSQSMEREIISAGWWYDNDGGINPAPRIGAYNEVRARVEFRELWGVNDTKTTLARVSGRQKSAYEYAGRDDSSA
jgi:hypothetical protein